MGGMKAPIAPIKKKVCSNHGDKRTDNYFWLRDKNNPEVKKYLKQENAYTEGWFADVEKQRERIFKELKSRVRDKDSSVPYFYNGYWYGADVVPRGEHSVNWRSTSKSGAKQILLDQNKMARGKKFFYLSSYTVSPDNKYLAYALDELGNTKYNIHFKEIESGKELPGVIKDVNGYAVWSNSSDAVWYLAFDEAHRPYQVWRYDIDSRKKTLVFEELNETYYVSLYTTTDREYVVINCDSHSGNKSYYFSSSDDSRPKMVSKHKKNVMTYFDHAEGVWYMDTNTRNPDGELLRSINPHLPISSWKSVFKPKQGSRLRGFVLNKHAISVEVMSAGATSIVVIPQKGRRYTIDTPEKVSMAAFCVNKDYSGKYLYYSYESMVTPDTIKQHSFVSRKEKVLKVYKPEGEYRERDYTTKQIKVAGHDGVKVPLTLIYKDKLFKGDGSNPCLLYGYGSYGICVEPHFNYANLSLLDRGFVYVVAHIRGGRDCGEAWYQNGKLSKKKNTFKDFISAAEALCLKKYTSSDKLFVRGGSAGGLLMGTVSNMRPDLFRGVISQVPFVDSLNTMLDVSIPLTVGEYVEWGNPNNKKDYDYMKSYAPYENIEAKDYPAMLITAGFHDTQVHYWESAKYVAKLRTHKTDKNPLLLKMDMDSGHAGKRGRYQYLEQLSWLYVFMFKILGIKH